MSPRLPTETRQAELVAAALALASACSPPLITTADIATAVGISQGAVFKHFATKDALWLAAMGWVQTTLLARLDAAAAGTAGPLDTMRAMFTAHVDFVVAHPGVPRVLFHELQNPQASPVKQQVQALMVAYQQRLRRLLAAAADQSPGLAPGLDHEAAAALFVGMVQGLVMQAMASGQLARMPAQAGPMFTLYLRAIGGAR
jgi:TetR/AcrR family transcriptional regulator